MVTRTAKLPSEDTTPDTAEHAATLRHRQASETTLHSETPREELDEGKNSPDSALANLSKRIADGQRRMGEQGLQPVAAGMSLAWQSLSIKGSGTKSEERRYAHTIGSLMAAPAISLMSALQRRVRSGYPKNDAAKTVEDGQNAGDSQKYLLRDLNGVLKPGEMMLVLGRPGAGTTTFLKAVAGLTSAYPAVDGQVFYGDIPGKKALGPLKGQVVYNADDEVHFANIKVDRTLDFALANNTPARQGRTQEDGEVPSAKTVDQRNKEELLKIFGLSHTSSTKVGDAYVRGVSGGERKRVSIAEVVARRASIQLWDKSTRGLDANTALDYVKIMRIMADMERRTIAISLYQAGNAIYNTFDKVLLIAEGRCIYFGPREQAQGYFEELGFEMLEGANVADFLTGCTALDERKVREGYEDHVPLTAQDFAEAYLQSDIHARMEAELQDHLADTEGRRLETDTVREIVRREKHKRAVKRSPYGVSLFRQIQAALLRERDNRWADRVSFWQRLGSPVVMAFVTGSLFYMVPENTGGLFLTMGVQFLTLIYPVILTMAETTAAFESRAILAKHKSLSLYSPSAFVIAQSIADLPMYFIPLSLYAIVLWFLSGMKMQAGPFFIFLLFTYTNTCTFAAFFRMVGSAFPTFEDASKISGFFFNLFATYSGYFIYIRDMKDYLGWTRWINPLFYAFEALTVSQMAGQQYECVPKQLVPYGPGYEDAASRGCAIPGSRPGELNVAGDNYLREALSFSHSHIWRNFAILLALWIFFIALTIVFSQMLSAGGSSGKGYLLFKRPSRPTATAEPQNLPRRDEHEKSEIHTSKEGPIRSKDGDTSDTPQLARSSVFTWRELTYTVRAGGADKTLLQDVQGWCKPGQLTALMGSSGAGKTTLMDVLAQRKTSGNITGEVLIDGHALPMAFQRTTGYCEQLDIHMPQSTVREALEFSALLRQPRNVSDAEKLAHVDTIVDLLELHDIEDALIGIPGAGLSVEQRKRLTIGVELAAKPRLLFADEPTSGLDGQSAFKVVKFLRKLADLGQSVLVTVHQPSAALFAEFDTLLLLKAGGKTAYFGPIDNMPEYFAENGFKFPSNVNPAEYMIEIVSGNLGSTTDWASTWLQSKQCHDISEEVSRLQNDRSKPVQETEQDKYSFASTTSYQMKLTLKRASVQMYRNTDYILNKIALHVGTGLLNGFSFWMIDNTYNGLQRRLFTIFGFIFVAPGVIAQMQPKFLANRDLYEAREKSAKMYTWQAFISAEILAEIPYLIVCGTIYFACWWAPAGFSFSPGVAGPVILQVYIYELLYTGIGQAIAAYAPNATFAALVNPVVISVLVLFNGAFVPYSQMQEFWKYWLYWLNPFNYLMGGLLVFPLWDQEVVCSAAELGRFSPPGGQTCGQYMSSFLSRTAGYLVDPNATDTCEYCIYSKGSEYLNDLNLSRKVYGWRDICITLLFAISSYSLVFGMMKLRTKQTKAASKK